MLVATYFIYPHIEMVAAFFDTVTERFYTDSNGEQAFDYETLVFSDDIKQLEERHPAVVAGARQYLYEQQEVER